MEAVFKDDGITYELVRSLASELKTVRKQLREAVTGSLPKVSILKKHAGFIYFSLRPHNVCHID